MKTTKRILSLILAVMMLASVASFSVMAEEDEKTTLTDIVTTTNVGKAVTRLVSMGIINGYPDGTFRPDNTITRAEFCVVMVKFEAMQDYIDPNALTGFEDLDTDENYAWARPYVAMAVQQGIINGFEDKTFRAADPVTYEQALKMLVCSLGYAKDAMAPTIPGDWSSGYVKKAMDLRITTGTTGLIGTKTKPATRGTVAILVNNALDTEQAPLENPGGDEVWSPGDSLDKLKYDEIKGIVYGTYITELEDADSRIPKNHIMIDDEYYEIGFSVDPNEFLGCEVEAVIYKDNDDGDYPVAMSLTLTKKSSVVDIEADLIGEFEDGVLQYETERDGKVREAKISDDYIMIFNNKYCDYTLEDVLEELESGKIALVDNNGDDKYDVIRVDSYEVFVVASKNSSSQKITLMYGAEYEGEPTITFPEESTSLVFSLTRNGKEIKFSDIAKWDVLNIKASPEDAEGRRYYEVIVTRQTVSGEVTERDRADESTITIGTDEYTIADSYLNYDDEEKPELNVGDSVQVYLDANGRIVAAAKASSTESKETYAYLFALRQDSDDSEFDLEFKLYTMDGKFVQIGSAAKITIDGRKYKALDDDILDYLSESADAANANYAGAENVNYHQLIVYQTNKDGDISTMYTVLSDENEKISAVKDNGDYYAGCDERRYSSSRKSFTDFKLSSSTDIIFVPDNRGNSDDYLNFTSYSKAFSNNRDYYVEAYGLSSSKTAQVVLIYNQNDSRIYTYATPYMIVASKSSTKEGTIIKGYVNGSTSLKSVTVDEEDGPSVSNVSKGDIIRYITNNGGKLIDYQVWFDASDPDQLTPASSVDDIYDDGDPETAGINRILEIHSTSTEPRKNYPTATFRLQYGTVTEIMLDEEGEDNIDEETITVSPVIVEDGVEMVYDGEGVVTRTIGSSVKVFYYDRGGRNSDVITNASMEDILAYVDYEEDATRVITHSSGSTLKMVYIIAD